MKVRIAPTSKMAFKRALESEGNQRERVLAFLETTGSRGATRLEICAGTGMKHESVSSLVTRLCDDRLAHENGVRMNDTGAPAKVVMFGPAPSSDARGRDERSERRKKPSVRELAERIAKLELGLAVAERRITELEVERQATPTSSVVQSAVVPAGGRLRLSPVAGRKVQLAAPASR